MCWRPNDIARWQKAAVREAERRPQVRLIRGAPLFFFFFFCFFSSDRPKSQKDVRESARWKQCNITARCFCLCRVRCHSVYNLPHGELLYALQSRPKRGGQAFRNLITSFIAGATIIRLMIFNHLTSFAAVKDSLSLRKNRGINVYLIQNTHPL